MGFYPSDDDYTLENDDYSHEDRLVGQIVTSASITSDKEIIELTLHPDRAVYLITEGGCCSHSWFSHVEGIRSLIGQEILSLESRPFNSFRKKDDDGYESYIKVYGFAIVTATGKTVFEFRNSSNGYYGGSVKVATHLPEWRDDEKFSPLENF